jgi:putative tryptophan/tyrosine transport system substrate-binding protein
LLRELVPEATDVAYIINQANPAFTDVGLRWQTATARSLGVHLLIVNASTPLEIEQAFATIVRERSGALLVGADSFFLTQRDQLVTLAARHIIPTSYFRREFVDIGGLISYSPDVLDFYRQAGIYAPPEWFW